MDFAIITDGSMADMTFDKATDVRNNIYLSLNIIKGSWWFNPDFGMHDTRRMKNTDKNALLVAVWIKEALQWMIDIGRAISVEVETQRDAIQSPNRLKAVITVVQANNLAVTFTHFVEVV